MPIGFGIPRALANSVRRLVAWVVLEVSGFIDEVGEDVTNETIDIMGIGYRECQNQGCPDPHTNDWHKCDICRQVLCERCGRFGQCGLCLKWFCINCSQWTIMECCDLQICPSCHAAHVDHDFYYLDCCEIHVCCGYEIWYDQNEVGYYCDKHISHPIQVLNGEDGNMQTRLRQSHHALLMMRMRARYGDEVKQDVDEPDPSETMASAANPANDLIIVDDDDQVNDETKQDVEEPDPSETMASAANNQTNDETDSSQSEPRPEPRRNSDTWAF